MKKYFLSALIFLAFLAAGCASQELAVKDTWARPAISGGNSAAYFVIDNPSGQADTLLRAESNVTDKTEIHLSMMMDMSESGENESEDGEMGMGDSQVMQMIQQESIPIPENDEVIFEPGGLHVMLIGIADGLEAGSNIEIKLFFENAGEIVLDVPVEER
jgi:copper(I)-binding protein